ncbi:ACT domain-containing protein ACR4-like [Lolium rigidum]|uniref:ACT domain-containing protein ACR4-like n=1 Tax=Lolium rigidum TaxID=89674 RepID=UPI001F5D367A|nr:ACT domain-containing protein ACR4-like [Lolium rigidum]
MMACGSRSNEMVDEFEKLVMRMNPPRVTVDNASDMTATLVKVDSANKYGTLLEVVQVLTDLKLTIKRAYISSDGEWFMDVFHVVDQEGNKLYDGQVIDRIEQSLGAGSLSFRGTDRCVGVEAEAEAAQTVIELVGRDRPGLLSEVFAVLTNLRCNIAASEVWTHDGRMAALVYVTDADNDGGGIEDPDRLDKVKRLLRHVLRGSSRDKKSARAAISSRAVAAPHAQRRLHQMMRADDGNNNNGEGCDGGGGRSLPVVAVEDCAERGYTLVNVRCQDRPKLLFDTVCTLTDMQYVVFHGTVIAEGSEAYQEFYIRHLYDGTAASDEDREQLRRGLEAAIQRRNTEGLGLELCCEDRVGLLSDVTRIFREHGLSVTHAEVETRGEQAANVFYVTTSSGLPVQAQAVEAVRAEIGDEVLFVREDAAAPKSPPGRDGGGRSLGNMIRSRSEKFLFNLGLIRSCS